MSAEQWKQDVEQHIDTLLYRPTMAHFGYDVLGWPHIFEAVFSISPCLFMRQPEGKILICSEQVLERILSSFSGYLANATKSGPKIRSNECLRNVTGNVTCNAHIVGSVTGQIPIHYLPKNYEKLVFDATVDRYRKK